MSAALAWCLDEQRAIREDYASGNPMAALGMADLVAEEVLIRLEEEESKCQSQHIAATA